MEESIQRFAEQFSWEPSVAHVEALRPKKHVIVAGMGGSHLGAWFLKRYGGLEHMFIHRDYGLPQLPQDILEDSLIILSSYSGGTEEVLDAGRTALEKGLSIAAISIGGKLTEFSRDHALPHVVLPDMGLQPRLATGLSMLALARLLQNFELESAVRSAGSNVRPEQMRADGERIAEILRGKVPIVYATHDNVPISYLWKIKFNESAKIPAFCNSFPEMCHNELTGFDTADSTRPLSANMHAIMLEDEHDHPRNRIRMDVAASVLLEKGVPVIRVPLSGAGFEKVFSAGILADWISLSLAHGYGVPDEQVPLVEDFKKRIG